MSMEYNIKLPNGKTLSINSEHQISENELDEIYSKHVQELKSKNQNTTPQNSPPEPENTIGQNGFYLTEALRPFDPREPMSFNARKKYIQEYRKSPAYQKGLKPTMQGAVLAGSLMLPGANLIRGGGILASLGNMALTGAYQGGLIGAADSLIERGFNPEQNLMDTTKGAGIGAGSGVVLGVGMNALPYLAKPINGIKNWAYDSVADISRVGRTTMQQAMKPESRALDFSKDDAQNLLANTTARIQKDFENLLAKKGAIVGGIARKLPRNKGVEVSRLYKGLDDIYNSYSTSGNDTLNVARNQAGGVYNDVADLIENARMPQAQKDKMMFEQLYNNHLQGKLNPRSYIDILSETPEIWQQQGLKNYKMTTNQDILKKIGREPNKYNKNHNIDENVIRNLPDLLHDPNYIMKSNSVDNRYVGILDALDNNGNPVMVAVSPNGKFNFIPSMYGKDNFNNFILNQKNAGNILYNKGVNSPQVSAPIAKGERFTPKDIISQLPKKNNINAPEIYDIQKNISAKTNWDNPNAKLQNEILERLYGNYSGVMNELSPELAQANSEFSQLKKFQKNEGVRRILTPTDANKIDSGSSALRNYKNTITKGNTRNNVSDLEETLKREGYEPFLNEVDDINAAYELNSISTTGDSISSNLSRAMIKPALRLGQNINKFNTQSPVGRLLKRGTKQAKEIVGQQLQNPALYTGIIVPQILQGQVEHNEYR